LDVTEKELLEKQLQQAQKMEAIGTLAGGIAHDFNNLLMAMQGNASLMLLDVDSSHPHYEKLKNIEQYIRRGADITSRLLSFSRRQPLSPTLIDLGQILRASVELLSSSLPDNITVSIHNTPSGLQPFADPGRLEDALVNIVFNARDAMPEGGEISFTTQSIEVANRLVMD